MSKAETFLKRQRQSNGSVSSRVQALSHAEEPKSHEFVAVPRSAVPERPPPLFGGPGAVLPESPRRRWPGVVAGIVGVILILGVVGERMNSSGGRPVQGGGHQKVVLSQNAEDELQRYFSVGEEECQRWFIQVRTSPHVLHNAQYLNVAKELDFFYAEDDSTVNAQAGINKKSGKRFVRLCGGAVRFARLASLAVAAQQLRKDDSCARFLRTFRLEDCGKMDDERVVELIKGAELLEAVASVEVISHAKMISAGMLMGVLAHEVGHQALNHTLGKAQNLVISRNQEREADLFASSITAASDFGEHILEGMLVWWYALALHESKNGESTTHPLSIERYNNIIRSHESLARTLGFREIKK